MVLSNEIWKLFFVWSASTIHDGYIVGYMYSGNNLSKKDFMKLYISEPKGFYWVNLHGLHQSEYDGILDTVKLSKFQFIHQLPITQPVFVL